MRKIFWLYISAKSLLIFSDILFIMTMTFFMYEETQSAAYAALFPLIRTFCQLLSGFVSPVLTDRFGANRLLYSIPLVRLGLIFLFTIQFDLFQEHSSLLFVALILISIAGGIVSPLNQAIMPILIPADQLVKANGISSILNQIVQVAGYSFTGVIVMFIGPAPTFGLTAIVTGTSYLLLLPILPMLKSENTKQTAHAWQSMKEGWMAIWQNKTIRTLTFMDFCENMAGAIWIGAITLVFVTQELGETKDWWGFINAAYYVGAILGGVVAALLSRLIQKHLLINMAMGSIIYAILTITYGFTAIPWVAIFLCILMGPAYQIRDVSQQTILQTEAPVHLLSKVYAAHYVLSSVSVGLSVFMVGVIADIYGVRVVYILGGSFVLLCSSFAILYLLAKASITQKGSS
ncbi:MFS transporter [Bacillus sp. NPDC077027]|uniref:MFS transporter n=1 Tax=Bacillus sp. NPDC077027 TaxID=3390548 RepID=UPI003CFDEA90